ncbi:MAG: hypothetical protein PHE02_07345 [Lachnospiraceae bacterium]|nr:hypothetical protein [Lachnospiraceae bacterium]
MNEQKGKFDFCPKCGAVTKDGVCQSCGYQLPVMPPEEVLQVQSPSERSEDFNGDAQPVMPPEEALPTQSPSERSEDFNGDAQPVMPPEEALPTQSPSERSEDFNGDAQQPLDPMLQHGVYSERRNAVQNSQPYQGEQYQNNQQQNNQQQLYPGNQYQNVQQPYPGTPYQNTQQQSYQRNPYPNGPQYPGNQYQNSQGQKKGQNTGLIVALAIVGTIFVLGIIVVIIVGFLTMKTVQTQMTQSEPYTYENPDGESKGNNTESPFDNGEDRGTEEPFTPDQSTGEDPFLADGYVNSWGTDHQNHDRSEFTGEYYDSICESIDESVAYKINREYYEYYSDEGNVAIRVGYYQLEGDIPNLEELNNDILMYSAYMAGNYFDSYGESGYEGTLELNTDSYVTFNDDKVMSIVLDEHWYIDEGAGFDLYGINIDLQNGSIIKNDGILDIDEKFAQVFKDRNVAQNETDGPVAIVDDSTLEELAEYLNDSTQSIIFYTPQGMEVGFNYASSAYSGWVTVTFKDYEKYLKSF